jgi:hypothetical protein
MATATEVRLPPPSSSKGRIPLLSWIQKLTEYVDSNKKIKVDEFCQYLVDEGANCDVFASLYLFIHSYQGSELSVKETTKETLRKSFEKSMQYRVNNRLIGTGIEVYIPQDTIPTPEDPDMKGKIGHIFDDQGTIHHHVWREVVYEMDGRLSDSNLHYRPNTEDPFSVPRGLTYYPKIPSVWTTEHYEQLFEFMEEIAKKMQEGRERVRAFCNQLGITDEMIEMVYDMMKKARMYQRRTKWADHVLWSLGQSHRIQIELPDDIDEIDFYIQACLAILPSRIIPTE